MVIVSFSTAIKKKPHTHCRNSLLFLGICPENVKITKCINIYNNTQWELKGASMIVHTPRLLWFVYITMDECTLSDLRWFHHHITHLYTGNVH
jgi:hypothetical protein